MEKIDKSPIRVTCAIIESNGLIMAAQRSEKMYPPLKWEFPGGKVEPGEKTGDTIVREIREELKLEVRITGALESHVYSYGEKTIELIPFLCRIAYGTPVCTEHKEIMWDRPENMKSLDWAGADAVIYNEYMEYIRVHSK